MKDQKIFNSKRIYIENEIYEIALNHGLTGVDCLKEDNTITVEELIDGQLAGECLFEFTRINATKFNLTWTNELLLKS